MKVEAARYHELEWLVARTGYAPTQGARAIKATDGEGRIRGMVAFDGWTPASVQAHIALDTPVAWRSLLVPTFDWAFNQLGKRLMVGTILGDNARSLKLATSCGFREVHRVRDGWNVGVDLVFLELRREECRFIAPRKVAA